MVTLFRCIRKYGFFHGLNNAFFELATAHAKTEKKKTKILETYLKNENDINEFYSKMLRYM